MKEISMHQSLDYSISSAHAMCKQQEGCIQWEVWRYRYSSRGMYKLLWLGLAIAFVLSLSLGGVSCVSDFGRLGCLLWELRELTV
jgi:hypothetical protein